MKSLQYMLFSSALFTQSVAAETLLEIYHQAEQNAPQLKIATATRQSTVESKPLAESALNPTVALGASLEQGYNTKDFFGDKISDATTLGYTLSLAMPLYDRASRIGVKQADLQIQQADQTLEAARQALMLQTAQAYFDVLARQDDLRLTQASKQAFKKQLEQMQQRFNVGLIANTDVQESQAAYDGSVADEIQAQNALDTAFETLREITGQYHETLATLKANAPLVSPTPNNIQQWTDTALTQNPNVQAAQVAIEIAQQQIDKERAANSLTLDLAASHGYQHALRGDLSNGSDEMTQNQVGLQLSYPLYTGGAVGAKIKIAQQDYNKAIDSLEKSRREIQKQTHSAFLSVLSNISRVKALEQSVKSNQVSLEATQIGFDVGTRTSVDILNAQTTLLSAQKNYSQTRYAYIMNTLTLKHAAGTLSVQDLESLNAWLVNPEKQATTKPISEEKIKEGKTLKAAKKAEPSKEEATKATDKTATATESVEKTEKSEKAKTTEKTIEVTAKTATTDAKKSPPAAATPTSSATNTH